MTIRHYMARGLEIPDHLAYMWFFSKPLPHTVGLNVIIYCNMKSSLFNADLSPNCPTCKIETGSYMVVDYLTGMGYITRQHQHCYETTSFIEYGSPLCYTLD